jgi:hypothetical protein
LVGELSDIFERKTGESFIHPFLAASNTTHEVVKLFCIVYTPGIQESEEEEDKKTLSQEI